MGLHNYQLKASFVLEDVQKYIKNLPDGIKTKIYQLFEYDSYFEIVSNFPMEQRVSNQGRALIGLVAQNILQRGFPTFAPKILDELELLENEELSPQNILNSLVIYDREIEDNTFFGYYGKSVDNKVVKIDPSSKEVEFLSKLDPFVFQHMEMQKPVEHLIKCPNTQASKYSGYTNYCLNMALKELLSHFKNQLLDFAITLPGGQCMNVEIDGMQHMDSVQAIKDKERDLLCKELNWRTLRVPVSEIGNPNNVQVINSFFADYRGNVLPDVKPKDYIRTPLYAARYAVMFTHFVNCGVINIFEKGPICLEIETMYRDAAVYGIRHAIDVLYNLAALLENKSLTIPDIYLKVTSLGGTHHKLYTIRPMSEPLVSDILPTNFNKNCLLIDEKMDSRLNLFTLNYDVNKVENTKRKKACLFSSFGQSHEYAIKHSPSRINYKLNDSNDENLKYFLRNIFRKVEFRDKQLDIIKGLIEGHNVIGILPTGSGKTLTFQLPAFLNPGTTLVISPLISLMNDQVHNLCEIGVSNVATVNSAGTSDMKRLILNKFTDYAYNFIYISPERLQISSFKSLLEYSDISLVVVDEAHCVSQWGHDFRTAYLRVGRTIFDHVEGVNVAALTGTASCNVVADIKRELEITRNLKIVQADDFRREELNFKVIHLDQPYTISDKLQGNIIPNVLASSVALLERSSNGIVRDFYIKKNDKYQHSGILYSPYAVSAKASIQDIRNSLEKSYPSIEFGNYHGKLNANVKENQQRDFTDGKTSILVATKAFGMGIDKDNIRLTVHLCIPESIEGFYQEAGRAGRDKRYALNVIVAPPPNTSYDECPDSSIHDFFMSSNYPPLEELLKQAKEYMSKKYINKQSFREIIARNNDEDSLDGFVVTASNGRIYLDFKSSKTNNDSLGKHEIHIGKSNTLEYGAVVNATYDKENIAAGIYLNNVLEAVNSRYTSDVNSTDISSQSEFYRNFHHFRMHHGISINGALRKAFKDDTSVTCYVGLNADALSHPITLILHDVIAEKQSLYDSPLVIDAGHKAQLDSIKEFTKNYNRTLLFDFYACFKSFAAEHNILNGDVSVFNKAVNDIRQSLKSIPIVDATFVGVLNAMQGPGTVGINTLCSFYSSINDIREKNGLPRLTIEGFCNELERVSAITSNTVVNVEEKIIYYLGILGAYTSFERAYSPDYMKITIVKVTKSSLLENIRGYIRRFETNDYVNRRVNSDMFNGIDEQDVVTLVNEALKCIIKYSYDKIKAYRCQQSKNMYACILENDEKNTKAFESAVYRYFEAKYANDLTNFVKKENPKGVVDWIKQFRDNINTNENEFAMINLSHLRTSAKKVLVDYDESYSLRLFEAYGILQDKDLLVEDGLDIYIEAIKKLQSLNRSRYATYLNEFCEICLDISDMEHLENIKKSFDRSEFYSKCPELKEFKQVLDKKLEILKSSNQLDVIV